SQSASLSRAVSETTGYSAEGRYLGGWWVLRLVLLEQQPLYNSINFNLSVAYQANDTVSLTPISVYLCPSDPGPSLIPVFEDPPDPNSPGTYNGIHVVDTLARGNYVGMWGLGEL